MTPDFAISLACAFLLGSAATGFGIAAFFLYLKREANPEERIYNHRIFNLWPEVED